VGLDEVTEQEERPVVVATLEPVGDPVGRSIGAVVAGGLQEFAVEDVGGVDERVAVEEPVAGRGQFLPEVFAADDRAHVGVGLDVLPALAKVFESAVEAELLGDPGVVRDADRLKSRIGEGPGEGSQLVVEIRVAAVRAVFGGVRPGENDA